MLNLLYITHRSFKFKFQNEGHGPFQLGWDNKTVGSSHVKNTLLPHSILHNVSNSYRIIKQPINNLKLLLLLLLLRIRTKTAVSRHETSLKQLKCQMFMEIQVFWNVVASYPRRLEY